jgi:hypothetical protein
MADALAGEIERQSTRPRRGGQPWGLPPHIARASASREKKPPPPKAVKVKPAPVAVKIVPPSIPITGRVLATFNDYAGLQHAIRGQVAAIGFNRETLDALSGLPDRYSGKLLGLGQRSGGNGPVKKLGKQSLGGILGAVGSYLALFEDQRQMAKLKAVSTALLALDDVAALGIDGAEFERLAGLAVSPGRPGKTGIGHIGDTLDAIGCRLALIEDPIQTARMKARAKACHSAPRSPVRTINRSGGERGAHA